MDAGLRGAICPGLRAIAPESRRYGALWNTRLDVGIGCLTVYAFSSDNWRRPAAEVQSIFWLLRAFLRLERVRLRQAGARLEVIGRRDRIPKLLLREIDQAIAATAGGTQLLLRVAIDYSSRDCDHARGAWRISQLSA